MRLLSLGILSGVALIGLTVVGPMSCTTVPPGHVGIKVNQWGSAAGVDPKPYGVGRYWTPPFSGITYYEYPTFTTTHAWTKTAEGGTADESIPFQDKSGLPVNADVSVQFHADPSMAPKLFNQYRLDMDGIVNGPLRNSVRNAIVETASDMGVEDIYGAKKSWLISQAHIRAQQDFSRYGLIIDQLYWASNIRLPATILAQINARIANEQEALAAGANVQTVKANADANVAKATGDANATLVRAKAEADAMTIKAAAIANSPKLVAYEWVKQWNGQMPATVYCTSTTPCVQGSQ